MVARRGDLVAGFSFREQLAATLRRRWVLQWTHFVSNQSEVFHHLLNGIYLDCFCFCGWLCSEQVNTAKLIYPFQCEHKKEFIKLGTSKYINIFYNCQNNWMLDWPSILASENWRATAIKSIRVYLLSRVYICLVNVGIHRPKYMHTTFDQFKERK